MGDEVPEALGNVVEATTQEGSGEGEGRDRLKMSERGEVRELRGLGGEKTAHRGQGWW